MKPMIRLLAATAVGLTPGLSLAATAGWDESTMGDLSSDHSAPTVITAALGDNVIAGTVGDTGSDWFDIFAFDAHEDMRLSALEVNYYDETDGNYTSLVMYPSDVGCNCTGYEAYGKIYEHTQGEDISNIYAPTFDNGLSLDHYFVLAEAQSAPATYELNFVFDVIPGSPLELALTQEELPTEVPLPAGVYLFGSALLGLAAKRKVSAKHS